MLIDCCKVWSSNLSGARASRSKFPDNLKSVTVLKVILDARAAQESYFACRIEDENTRRFIVDDDNLALIGNRNAFWSQ